jgi:endoglycosylceramidase
VKRGVALRPRWLPIALVGVLLVAGVGGGSFNRARAAPALTTAARVSAVPPISHAGRWLTDGSGRVVIYHGVDVATKRPPNTDQSQGFTQADAQDLAHEGFTVLRTWWSWAALEPTPGHFNDDLTSPPR